MLIQQGPNKIWTQHQKFEIWTFSNRNLNKLSKNRLKCINMYFLCFCFFSIRPPPGLLNVLGLLTRHMTPTIDAALLICGSLGRGRTTSSRAGVNHLLVGSVHRAFPLYL